MDLDELAAAIKKTSSDPIALKLSDLISSWKADQLNAIELESNVERYIGNTWMADTIEHEKIYALWSQFRGDAIHGIGGMTMNERLYCFSLFPLWDDAKTEEERKAIYAKLLANP